MTAIVFVVDCSSFDVVDTKGNVQTVSLYDIDLILHADDLQLMFFQNQFRESLELFENIWNDRWLRNVSIILFLTKQDILQEKLEKGKKIEDYFPDFSAYRPPESGVQIMQHDIVH